MNDFVTTLIKTENLAKELLDEYGLTSQGWTFKLGNSQRTLGWCKYTVKRIEFSKYYLAKTPWYEIEDTLRHEIAHALVGSDHGHDYVWKAKCREVGARPQRLASEVAKTTAKHNYKIVCNGCGKVWYRYRLKPGYLNNPNFVSGCCGTKMKVYKIVRKAG